MLLAEKCNYFFQAYHNRHLHKKTKTLKVQIAMPGWYECRSFSRINCQYTSHHCASVHSTFFILKARSCCTWPVKMGLHLCSRCPLATYLLFHPMQVLPVSLVAMLSQLLVDVENSSAFFHWIQQPWIPLLAFDITLLSALQPRLKLLPALRAAMFSVLADVGCSRVRFRQVERSQ